MDQFKQYLKDNREALDADEPRQHVWAGIEENLPRPVSKISVLRIATWAAAACVVVLAGVGISRFARNEIRDTSSGLREIASNVKPETSRNAQLIEGPKPVTSRHPELAEGPKPISQNPYPKTRNSKPLSPTPYTSKPQTLNPIANLEANFTQVINLQRARISTMPMYAESAAYFNDFKVQLKQMDQDEQVIKKDISRKGMSDEALDQLINLYQQKLNILKQLQLEMNKTNNRYKQNRGAVDTVRTYFLSI